MANKFNDERVIGALCTALEAGNYRETACDMAGIGKSTFYGWLERGEADLEAGLDTPYARIVERVTESEARGEADLLEMIRAAAPKNWQAAAWMLERKMPEKYGRRDAFKVEHSGRVAHDLAGMSTDDLEELAGQLADQA